MSRLLPVYMIFSLIYQLAGWFTAGLYLYSSSNIQCALRSDQGGHDCHFSLLFVNSVCSTLDYVDLSIFLCALVPLFTQLLFLVCEFYRRRDVSHQELLAPVHSTPLAPGLHFLLDGVTLAGYLLLGIMWYPGHSNFNSYYFTHPCTLPSRLDHCAYECSIPGYSAVVSGFYSALFLLSLCVLVSFTRLSGAIYFKGKSTLRKISQYRSREGEGELLIVQ